MRNYGSDIGGKQEEVMSVGKFGRYKAEIEEMIVRRERLALRNKIKSGNTLRYMGD